MAHWQAYALLPRHRRIPDGPRHEAIGDPFEARDRIAADAMGRALSLRFAFCRSLVSNEHNTILPRPEAWWRKAQK